MLSHFLAAAFALGIVWLIFAIIRIGADPQ